MVPSLNQVSISSEIMQEVMKQHSAVTTMVKSISAGMLILCAFFLGSKIGNASCYVCNKLTEYDVHLTGSKVDSSGVVLAFDGMAVFMTVLYPAIDYRDVTGSVVGGGAVRNEFGDHRTKLPI